MKKESPTETTIKAMIFDMDGTVINSNKLDYEAWREVFEDYGISLKYEEYIKLLGATSEEIIQKYLDIGMDEMKRLMDKREMLFRESVEKNGIKVMPHIKNILDQVRKANIKLALATGAKREKLDFMLEKTGLEGYFDAEVTSDDVEKGKPNPETFLQAVKKLNVQPEEVLVWEDAEKGVEAAKNGNLKCIAITTTNGGKKGLEKADIIIDTYEGLRLEDILKEFPNESGTK